MRDGQRPDLATTTSCGPLDELLALHDQLGILDTLDQLDVTRMRDDIHILAAARSFLHTQVRSMVGALVLVGEGKWTADDVSLALYRRDRAACAPLAPPDGLYLVSVDYPEQVGRAD